MDTTNCIQSKLFEAEEAASDAAADAPDWTERTAEFRWPSVWQTTFNSVDYLETHGRGALPVAAGISTIIMWHWQDSLVSTKISVMDLYNVDIFQVLEGQS